MKLKIAVVVVTYNRLEYLKQVITGIRSQETSISEIIVVNNSSTDGTSEWLATQDDLSVISQDNLGGAGGFNTGMKYAYKNRHDWIWIMDDDVVPHKDCLKILLSAFDDNTIRSPLRLMSNGMPYKNDTLKYNFTNPFVSLWNGIVDDKDLQKEFINCDGPTFEGALFHRSIIERIGIPEPKFFIFADDTEYFLRASKSGAKIILFTKAKMQRMIDCVSFGRNFTWKHYYIIRNIIALDVLYGNLPVRLFRPLAYFAKWFLKAKSFKDKKIVLKAFKNGYFFKSSKNVLTTKENSER